MTPEWRSHAATVGTLFEDAKANPQACAWDAVCRIKRAADQAVQALARAETRVERTAPVVAAVDTIASFLRTTRASLRSTATGWAIEHDGTTYAAPSLVALAATLPALSVVGGFVDYRERA